MPSNPIILRRADYSIQAASVVILFYDYLLTLPNEVQYMWRGAKKTTVALYIFCRYAMIANLMYLLYKTPGFTGLNCLEVSHTSGALAILGHIGVLGVWGLRTCAICHGSRIVPIILGLLGFAIVGLRIASQVLTTCGKGYGSGFSSTVGIAVAALMMGFEALAFILAAVRVWKTVRDDRKFWTNPQASINYVIFSQGLLYIAAVFGLSILTAIFNLHIWEGVARPLNSLKLPLSGLLTARFLLKLRTWERNTRISEITHSTAMAFEHPPVPQSETDSSWRSMEDSYEPRTGIRSKGKGVIESFGLDIGPALAPTDLRLKRDAHGISEEPVEKTEEAVRPSGVEPKPEAEV